MVAIVVVPDMTVAIDVVVCVVVATFVMMIVEVGAKDVDVAVIQSAVLVSVMVKVAESKPRLLTPARRSLRSEILWMRSDETRRPRDVSRRRGLTSRAAMRPNSEAAEDRDVGKMDGHHVKVGSWLGCVEILHVFVDVLVVTIGAKMVAVFLMVGPMVFVVVTGVGVMLRVGVLVFAGTTEVSVTVLVVVVVVMLVVVKSGVLVTVTFTKN